MPIQSLSRTLIASVMIALCGVPLWTPKPAKAQVAPPVVSACSGVSLPRSVVTDILRPVIIGIAGPVQTRVNSVLGVVRVIPLVGQVFPPLNLNATGLLDDAERRVRKCTIERRAELISGASSCDCLLCSGCGIGSSIGFPGGGVGGCIDVGGCLAGCGGGAISSGVSVCGGVARSRSNGRPGVISSGGGLVFRILGTGGQ